MIVSPDTTVGEIASRFPGTIKVFQRLHVEFCCDGGRRLGEIGRDRQLTFDQLAAALRDAADAPPRPRHDWSTRSLPDLTAHIVEAFHEPLRQELPRLHRMALKVQRHTDPYVHVLAAVLYELERFNADLDPHMATEERELFPLIGRAASNRLQPGDRARFRQLRRALEAGHVEAGRALRILRSVTDRYVVPASACATLRDLYRGLKELEQLMQLHVHLENSLLFPRADALVAEAGSERS